MVRKQGPPSGRFLPYYISWEEVNQLHFSDVKALKRACRKTAILHGIESLPLRREPWCGHLLCILQILRQDQYLWMPGLPGRRPAFERKKKTLLSQGHTRQRSLTRGSSSPKIRSSISGRFFVIGSPPYQTSICRKGCRIQGRNREASVNFL